MALYSNMVQAQTLTPEQVVQKNLDYYNQRDIEGFMSLFSSAIQFFNFGDSVAYISGLYACRKVYQGLFDKSPQLHSVIIRRIVFGNMVIDHESISGRMGSDALTELVLMYEVNDGKIYKVTVIRK